jgi:hypothetical protein
MEGDVLFARQVGNVVLAIGSLIKTSTFLGNIFRKAKVQQALLTPP